VARRPSDFDIFHAIADPTRRRIIDLLAERPRAVLELVAAFKISQPSISEHLRILRQVGLTSVTKLGRQRIYSYMPIRLRDISGWIAIHERSPQRTFDQTMSYPEPPPVESSQSQHINSLLSMDFD
jgi:DNA-binding transcriptional ArsR family regulator